MAGRVTALWVRGEQEKERQRAERIILNQGEGIAGEKAGKGKSSLSLFVQDVPEMQRQNRGLCAGRFWENVTLAGLDPETVQVGSKLCLGEAVILVTEKKHCFPECELAAHEGDCGLRKQAMFAEVMKSGEVAVGDLCGFAEDQEAGERD